MQARLLNLYDPDRSQTSMSPARSSNWDDFTEMHRRLSWTAKKPSGGAGNSPSDRNGHFADVGGQIDALAQAISRSAKWHQYEPINSDNDKPAGAGIWQRRHRQAVYHFDKAKVIVSLDANFLMDHPGSVRYARDFAAAARVAQAGARRR